MGAQTNSKTLPTGQYCANVAGMADVKVIVDDESHLDLSASVFGETKSCEKEEYALDVASGAITLAHIQDEGDCVGEIFSYFGGDPSDLTLKYDSATDAIGLSVMGYEADLTQCGQALLEPVMV